jgi:hypothetical protein
LPASTALAFGFNKIDHNPEPFKSLRASGVAPRPEPPTRNQRDAGNKERDHSAAFLLRQRPAAAARRAALCGLPSAPPPRVRCPRDERGSSGSAGARPEAQGR